MTSSPRDPEYAFGQLAIQQNLCTISHVREALDIQARLRRMGVEPKKLGQILIERGYLTAEQLERLLRVQGQTPAVTRVEIPGYELRQKIGQGGMGAVYRARQKSMDRDVAVKVLSPKFVRDRSFVQRFLREARAVARLNHPNIIAGIDVGEASGFYYFVMEYVEGETVAEILRREGRLEEGRALSILRQIAQALDHAHRHGLVHRDIKPANIMITPDGRSKLCDLGLAKHLQGAPEASLTMQGTSVGTPMYISPEQARGEERVDIRSDLYSLGATFYHMVVGEIPYDGPSAMIMMTRHVTEPPPSAREKNPALQEETDRLIRRLMAKNPSDRPADPAELLRELEALGRGEEAPAASPSSSATVTPVPSRRPSTRRMRLRRPRRTEQSPYLAALVSTVFLAAAALLVFYLWHSRDSRKDSKREGTSASVVPAPSDSGPPSMPVESDREDPDVTGRGIVDLERAHRLLQEGRFDEALGVSDEMESYGGKALRSQIEDLRMKILQEEWDRGMSGVEDSESRTRVLDQLTSRESQYAKDETIVLFLRRLMDRTRPAE